MTDTIKPLALVTGVGPGTGAATVRRFAEGGYRVAMLARDARQTRRKLLVSKRPMTRVGRAVEKGETKGFMKVVADAETKQILGAAILGVGGDEAIHGILDMMNAGAAYPVMQWAVPIHPTVSELIPTVIGDLKPLS